MSGAELHPESIRRLEELAARTGRPMQEHLDAAIEHYVADALAVQASIERSRADVAAGRVVPHRDVVAWLETWGTDEERSAP